MISEWLGIPAAFLAWGFALYVFIISPPTRSARFLVAMLVIDGVAVISSHDNGPFVDAFLGGVFGIPPLPWSNIHQASDWAPVATYLPFLGTTLDSPLVNPLKNPTVRAAIMAIGLAIAVIAFVLPEENLKIFREPFYIVIVVVLA